jgi:hypothetical protein
MDAWRSIIFGPGVHVFNVLYIYYLIWALVNFYKRFKSAEGLHRWQLKYFLIGLVISSVFGLLFDLIFPWLNILMYDVYSVWGAMATIIWLGFSSYILFKKNI